MIAAYHTSVPVRGAIMVHAEMIYKHLEQKHN